MIRLALAGLLVLPLLVLPLLAAPDESKAPIASNPVVEISGRITRVDPFRPGERMPGIVVDVNGKSTSVLLCAMRYLLEQNFNPKAGTEVQVKGYKLPDMLVAIEVKLLPSGKVLKLRDDNGWPVWRGGGGYRHRGGVPE
jgi:hypothetical protein